MPAPGFDQRTGEPTVNFRFDSVGAREFGDVTKAYPPQTQRFAIVLDKQVISAPVINEPILGGSGQITGIVHTAERQRSGDPAARRRAAGAAEGHRRAHRRRRTRRGFGQGRPLFGAGGPAAGRRCS